MTTFNQVYPGVASATVDNYVPQKVLLDGENETQVYTMPANKAVAQWEVVKLVGDGIVQYTAAAVAGDVLGIACYAADNLTATAVASRSATCAVFTKCKVNQNGLVFVGGNTAAGMKAIARACGIRFENPLSFQS